MTEIHEGLEFPESDPDDEQKVDPPANEDGGPDVKNDVVQENVE